MRQVFKVMAAAPTRLRQSGEIKAGNTEAVRISSEYGRSSSTPNDVLTPNQYEVVKKGTVCEDTKVGVYIDGQQQGQKVKVCTNTKCSLHFSYNVQPGSSSPDMKEKRAKARKEAAVRAHRGPHPGGGVAVLPHGCRESPRVGGRGGEELAFLDDPLAQLVVELGLRTFPWSESGCSERGHQALASERKTRDVMRDTS